MTLNPDNHTTYSIDLNGENGTPFRFTYDPERNLVRQMDRRYTLKPGESGYGPNHMNEQGQMCGPARYPTDYIHATRGFRGWHEVTTWDVDGGTAMLVGLWLRHIRTSLKIEETES